MKGRTLLGKNEGEGRKIGLRRRTCLFACAVAFALTASGQNLRTQVTNFSVTNVTLKEALQQLEKQVDLGFFYESAEEPECGASRSTWGAPRWRMCLRNS